MLTIILCKNFRELKKYSSASVIPGTRVYLNISSFNTGELICLTFNMNLFFVDDDSQRESYTFQIDQVSATNYDVPELWNNLRTVTNQNVTKKDMKNYIFSWNEVKQEGKNYIFIIPITPFENYYNFWKNEIDIKNIEYKDDDL